MPPSQVGDEAPDFDLPAVVGNIKQRVKLSSYRGKKNVVLAFYVLNWTPV
jgi:peroxiredoxin